MDINQIIKERLGQLPNDIQQAIQDGDLASKFDQIAEKNNLHIDQNGNLQTETLLVMLGLENSSNYISNIQKSLEIEKDEAIAISNDVNEIIFKPIKDSLRIIQELHDEIEQEESVQVDSDTKKDIEQDQNPISDLERIGQFTIEPKPAPSSSSLYKDTNLNREEILRSIEDPQPENKPLVAPLVDHLLTTPINNVQKVETKEIKEIVDKNLNQTPKTYSADPYREQII